MKNKYKPLKYKYKRRSRKAHAPLPKIYNKESRKRCADKIRQYRKRFKLLNKKGIDFTVNHLAENENVKLNEKIDKVLNEAGLGDIRHANRKIQVQQG